MLLWRWHRRRKRSLLHPLLHRRGVWQRLLLWHRRHHRSTRSGWDGRICGRPHYHVSGREPPLLALERSPPPGPLLIGLGVNDRSRWEGQLRLTNVALKGMLGGVGDHTRHTNGNALVPEGRSLAGGSSRGNWPDDRLLMSATTASVPNEVLNQLVRTTSPDRQASQEISSLDCEVTSRMQSTIPNSALLLDVSKQASRLAIKQQETGSLRQVETSLLS